eukprot:TRINITY_DN23740_c0_g7_i1.p1 TRINITY_DN23740_c0_g7~~TRINITY_DN23740_c0_g7_i1.p1  ORF type:complete len:665 (-),score=86.91 TRINITY_DN23740_c0_g7_i1:133-2127(-)
MATPLVRALRPIPTLNWTSCCAPSIGYQRAFASGCSAAADSTGGSNSTTGQTGYSARAVVAAGALGVVVGVVASREDARLKSLVLPAQSFRACCDTPLTESQKKLPSNLEAIVGREHVSRHAVVKGTMVGQGTALAVVKPGTLKEAVSVLRACVAADVAVIPQGANTGLTGGGVPRDAACDRPMVVLNMRRLNKILPIGPGASHVLCFSGAGIFDLQEALKKQFNRDSHSVLGSIFLNPSVGAGVAFGSGGTQIRKGPVFTERALYCRVTEQGNVELVDTLGLKGFGDGDRVLETLESCSALTEADLDSSCCRAASWPRYTEHITRFDGSVSRFNADTTGIDCNRSEGKVLILATLHDTHPMPESTKIVWIGCKDFATANALKREVFLASPTCMAKSCEYVERHQFDVIDQAGRMLIKVIEVVGMQHLSTLWNLKLWIESLPVPFAGVVCDKVLWWANSLLPESLPPPMMSLGRQYDHSLLVELSEYSDGEVARLEARLEKFVAEQPAGTVGHYVCRDAKECMRAMLFRFAVQPSIRTYCVGKGLQGLIIDYAMPKNFPGYAELPEKKYEIEKRCLAAHFGCNVYHESIMFPSTVDMDAAKYAIKRSIEAQGGRLPAEHGHGMEYSAPAPTKERWQRMDPTNAMNPGVGGTSALKHYALASQVA